MGLTSSKSKQQSDRRSSNRNLSPINPPDEDDYKNSETAVFGVPLRLAAERSDPTKQCLVPAIMRNSIDFLNHKGLNEMGLYRVPGSKQTIRKYMIQFNKGEPIDFIKEHESGKQLHDPADVAGLILLFLRDLPESLFGNEHQELFILQRVPKHLRKQIVQNQMGVIPKCNRETIRLLVDHLIRVSKNEKVNKMSVKNIVLCIWGTSPYTPVFFTLIEEFDFVFEELDDEDVDNDHDNNNNKNNNSENNTGENQTNDNNNKKEDETSSSQQLDNRQKGDGEDQYKTGQRTSSAFALSDANNNDGGDSLEWLRRELESQANSPNANPSTTTGSDGRRGRPMTVSFDAFRLSDQPNSGRRSQRGIRSPSNMESVLDKQADNLQ